MSQDAERQDYDSIVKVAKRGRKQILYSTGEGEDKPRRGGLGVKCQLRHIVLKVNHLQRACCLMFNVATDSLNPYQSKQPFGRIETLALQLL